MSNDENLIAPESVLIELNRGQENPTYNFVYHAEKLGGDKLLVLIPGIEKDTYGEDLGIRQILYESSDLRVNTLSMEYVGKDFKPDQVAQDFIEVLQKLHEENGIDRITLMGTSYGGSIALAVAQRLNQTSIQGLEVDGLLLVTPAIDDESIRGGAAKRLKSLPAPVGKKAIQMLGKVRTSENIENTNEIFDPELMYQQIKSMPSPTYNGLPDECKVRVYLSESSPVIDSRSVERSLEKLEIPSSNLEIIHLNSSAIAGHKFSNEKKEWAKLAESGFVDFFELSFNQQLERDKEVEKDVAILLPIINSIEANDVVNATDFINKIEKLYKMGERTEVDSFLEEFLEVKTLPTDTLKEKLKTLFYQLRKKPNKFGGT